MVRGDGRLRSGIEALALTGLAKTLVRERGPGAGRLVDVEPGVPIDELVDELLGDRGVVEIGLSRDGAWTLATTATSRATGPDPLRPHDLVVATGGARGVTAASIAQASRTRPLSWLILGRTAPGADPEWAIGVDDAALAGRLLASRAMRPREAAVVAAEIRARRALARTISELQALGCAAQYVAVDGRDRERVAAAIRAAVERHGPVRGVVHGAGVLQDQRLGELTAEGFDEVVSTKVDGLRAVLAAVDERELRLCVAFTSVSGRFGNAGQASYAVANEAVVQELAALRLRAPGVAVKALDWGPWDGGMVTPGLKAAFERQGRASIPIAAGAAAFAAELGRGGVEVVLEAPRAPSGRIEVSLSGDAPWLRDHQISGRPVVPVAMVAEGLAHLASTVAPDRAIAAIRSLRVLKGIALDGATGSPATARVSASWELSGREIAFELGGGVAGNGQVTPHYRGTVELGPVPARPALEVAGLATDPYDADPERIYEERLFHGPAFHAILAVEGTSDRGLIGRVRTSEPRELGIARARWWFDPVAVDGVLQLVGLWVQARRDEGALPSALGELCWRRPAAGELACRLVVRDAGPGGGSFDADLVDAEGVVATIRGGEYTASARLAEVLRPSSG